ncbi:4Fe-4S binding protein [Agrobacterium vitis]|uniref:NosR/NirI family protein n=1 Tax=Rhizobium/Agrobacterium group TaxID=227290 RepID=UPI0012E815AA|nr:MULTISPECIES: NosR/NirI family protein [Rhizobium/Agrobacterium group]MCF1494481.1 regulatory protein NosR [Allorhizobium ampelinum]MVA45987.1 4Fe-4S binding protein [Agrobacterium vitis]
MSRIQSNHTPFSLRPFLAALLIAVAAALPAFAADLPAYLQKVQPGEIFPGADRFGAPAGEPPIAPVYRGADLAGYAYLNSDVTSSVGYSGKPIHIVVGIDSQGVVRGFKLVDHKEPIVLIGIPQEKVVAALNSILDKDMGRVASGADRPPQVDIVSGATVTVLVMGDSVIRSAVKLIRSNRLNASADAPAAVAADIKTVDLSKTDIADWQTLVGDGSVRSLHMTVGEVSDGFRQASHPDAADRPETPQAGDRFIDLYIAPVSVPAIGRSLLGEAGYQRLASRLKPGQSAVLVAGDGAYSFKGSGYVRGGIFDRIELLQDGQGLRFRDRDHTRLPTLAASGAPRLRDIALFTVPTDFALDVTQPFELQLLVQRSINTHDKAVIPYTLGYSLPAAYVTVEKAPAPDVVAAPAVEAAAAAPSAALQPMEDQALWISIWQMNRVSIAITVLALLVLTAIFFFQDWLVKRPVMFGWIRRGYLLFTLVWLGWYANAQLSVVNVLTFVNSLITGFNWEFFLAAPLVFILWAAVAAGLLFWGRGPFCGWLCPFGALQELTNNVAQWLKVPQVRLPWGLHERLWPIKYIIFLGLFGLSFYSLALAEMFSEVEPFKTAIVLKFAREWPFVLFALTLLSAGLFIERFYCRYLCPLGAALAIPGRIRMFEWLKRYPECGTPCQRCAKECPVQSIHPEGQINVNECIYCMHCQELYHDDHRCPHMIQVRLKREKFVALSTPASRGEASPRTIITHNGEPIKSTDQTTGNPL